MSVASSGTKRERPILAVTTNLVNSARTNKKKILCWTKMSMDSRTLAANDVLVISQPQENNHPRKTLYYVWYRDVIDNDICIYFYSFRDFGFIVLFICRHRSLRRLRLPILSVVEMCLCAHAAGKCLCMFARLSSLLFNDRNKSVRRKTIDFRFFCIAICAHCWKLCVYNEELLNDSTAWTIRRAYFIM